MSYLSDDRCSEREVEVESMYGAFDTMNLIKDEIDEPTVKAMFR